MSHPSAAAGGDRISVTGDGRLTALGLSELKEIGRGASATVFQARQDAFARDVAIKVLAGRLVDDTSRRRFARECQSLGQASAHPHVVSVFASGLDDEDRPFIVMELCPGGTLQDEVNRSGPMPVMRVLDLGIKVSSALAFAHEKGLLHRDIKPMNILINSFGEPMLSDFGIAGAPDDISLTIGGSMTPLYAAPEILSDGGGSAASDVWSLASTLYCLLLGRAPYAGTEPGLLPLMTRITQGLPTPLERGDLPPALNATLVDALAKDPLKRTQTALELMQRLTAVRDELQGPPTTIARPTSPPPKELAITINPEFGPSPTAELSKVASEYRFYFVLDTSSSMNDTARYGEVTPFMRLQTLVRNLILDLRRGTPSVASRSWIGALEFGSEARMILPLTKIQEFQTCASPQGGGFTDYALAFTSAAFVVEEDPKHVSLPAGRGWATPIVFFMTDGEPTTDGKTLMDTAIWKPTRERLHAAGAIVVAIGFGDVREQTLAEIASIKGGKRFAAVAEHGVDGQGLMDAIAAFVRVTVVKTVTRGQVDLQLPRGFREIDVNQFPGLGYPHA